jgi:hypothetical protein
MYIICCHLPLLGEDLGLFPKLVRVLCFSSFGRLTNSNNVITTIIKLKTIKYKNHSSIHFKIYVTNEVQNGCYTYVRVHMYSIYVYIYTYMLYI